MANGKCNDDAGQVGRPLIYREFTAFYDAKYAAANLRELGAAAIYPVQHGDGIHLAPAALYEP